MPTPVRAEPVGSLLRPPKLLEARQRSGDEAVSADALRALEDAAVREAITRQETAGMDVTTDGEMRRSSWIATRDGAVEGFSLIPGGPGWQWRGAASGAEWSGRPFPFVTEPIRVVANIADAEYPFLAEHASGRTKYSLPAPSYYRTCWHPERSPAAYASCEDFLVDMRDYARSVVARLVTLGCDYIQLDAPNYGNLCDPDLRDWMTSQGRDLDAELSIDAALDSSVFDGVSGVTRALHVCRGNASGNWAGNGGYARIAAELFPRLRVDRLLLEYDDERSGDFAPLAHVPQDTTAVLGLVTTKRGTLEDAAVVEQRLREAAQYAPIEQLALSPQCGFASTQFGNPLTVNEQDAKLRLVSEVARRVWR